ncbi:MAG: Ribosome maturation factor RimM [Pelotomaculum sp. PtaU1.Bin035]|nr:MAG: Ribosome maturation factor RimM [Pelotomaculum sp. PtaU1.Bin035]
MFCRMVSSLLSGKLAGEEIPMAGEYINIGKITNTQGNRGAVRVLPLTDYPERFRQAGRVRVSIKGSIREFNIEEAYHHKKFVVLKFKEIQDMNAAGELKGGLLVVSRDDLMPLPADSFYIFDLMGINVFDLSSGCLGKITDIIQTGSNDVYVVETGGKPVLIPALKQVVKEIDITGRRMVVELPEGLVD